MGLVTVDVKGEYRKRVPQTENDRFLDLVINGGLFPRKLYLPEEATIMELYLLMLLEYVLRMADLGDQEGVSLEALLKLPLREQLTLKNADNIFQETGRIVMTRWQPHEHGEALEILRKLYPRETPCFVAFDGLLVKKKLYHVLIQAGFRRKSKLSVNDNLPRLRGVILKDEKPIVYPLIDEVLKKLLFTGSLLYLN